MTLQPMDVNSHENVYTPENFERFRKLLTAPSSAVYMQKYSTYLRSMGCINLNRLDDENLLVLLAALNTAKRNITWQWVDVIANLMGRDEEAVQIVETLGYSESYIEDLVRTAGYFPYSGRTWRLSITHYVEAGRSDITTAKMLLAKAEANNWSVSKLRQERLMLKPKPEEPSDNGDNGKPNERVKVVSGTRDEIENSLRKILQNLPPNKRFVMNFEIDDFDEIIDMPAKQD